MRADEVGKLVVGSIVVYVVMAACGATGSRTKANGSGDGSADQEDALGESMADAVTDSVTDALTDPVTEAQADPYQSGTRLKANYWAGSDGSKQFTGWHDSQRKEDCSFTNAADNTTRCMPNNAYSSTFFVDSACSQPVYVSGDCNPVPGYVTSAALTSTFPSAGYNAHIFPIATPTTTVTAAYEITILSDGGCNGPYHLTCTAVTGWTTMAQPPNIVYTLGAEIPPSAFVQATTQTEP
jgi:hypothetical protein